MHKIGQLGGFLGSILGSLVRTGLLLRENARIPLPKSVLVQLRFAWIWYNNINDFKWRNKWYHENSQITLFLKGVSETIKSEIEDWKGGFLIMFLGTLSASLLGSFLTGKGTITRGERLIRAGQNF